MKSAHLVLALALVATAGGCDALLSGDTQEQAATSGPFDGVYVLDEVGGEDEEGAEFAQLTQAIFSPLKIQGDTLRYGRLIKGGFDLIEPKITGNTLKSEALWHEDVADPGDMTEVRLTLKKTGSKLKLSIHEDGEEATTLTYRKKTS